MILVEIVHVDKKQKVRWYDEEHKFKDFGSAKGFIFDDLGLSKHKKTACYVDDKEGNQIQIGYVFNKWNFYEDTGKRFPEEVWVSFRESNYVNLSS